MTETLRLRGQDVAVVTEMIDQRKLKFFVENPRVYSIVRREGREPTQEEIYKQLLELEHVRELKEDIKRNGGLIDPLIVRDGDFEVLEGNSRLAAYRWLFENDERPTEWAKVKCTLLPKDIDDKLVYALLGQYHVKGKKDWAPYEIAGFLFRRFKEHGDDIKTVASELSMKPGEARQAVDVFAFMLEHNDPNPQRWSYYDEYIKSKKIKEVRGNYPNFDKMVVGMIKSGEIERAVDVRDKLAVVCSAPTKIIKKFVEQSIDLEEAYTRAVDAGGEVGEYKRAKKFREWISDPDTAKDILDIPTNVQEKMIFELRRIETSCANLKKKLEGKVKS